MPTDGGLDGLEIKMAGRSEPWPSWTSNEDRSFLHALIGKVEPFKNPLVLVTYDA
jgi:hypothetical protein